MDSIRRSVFIMDLNQNVYFSPSILGHRRPVAIAYDSRADQYFWVDQAGFIGHGCLFADYHNCIGVKAIFANGN